MRVNNFGISGSGIMIDNFCSFVTIAQCSITNSNSYNGLRVKNSSDIVITNNVLTSARGIDFYYDQNSANNVTVQNNIVKNGNYYGVFFGTNGTQTTKNIVISSNKIISQSSDGIQIQYASNAAVANNVIDSSNSGGITFFHSDRNNVSNNTIQNCSGAGVVMYTSNDNTVVNNVTTANGSGGIYVFLGSSTNSIQGNQVRRLTQTNSYAIIVDNSASTGNMIYNNDLAWGYVTGGISDSGTGTLTSGNRL
jgi:parallel beta-helix repeat protein